MAINKIMSIHNEEMEAVIRGELTPDGLFERRLQEAREYKTVLINKYKTHIATHGCLPSLEKTGDPVQRQR